MANETDDKDIIFAVKQFFLNVICRIEFTRILTGIFGYLIIIYNDSSIILWSHRVKSRRLVENSAKF